MKHLFLTFCLLFLAACEDPPPPPPVHTVTQIGTGTLYAFKPPKNTYATLALKPNLLREFFISKHCNGWRKKAIIGKEYPIYLHRWTWETGKTRTEEKLNKDDFCTEDERLLWVRILSPPPNI